MERSDRPPVAAFFSSEDFIAGDHVSLGDDAAQHARVLRIGPGTTVELRNGSGGAARGVIARISKRSVMIDINDVWSISPASPVHLLVPVADRDRMLMLAEKATELGAASWRPVIWRHSKSVSGRGEGPTFVGRVRARMIAALTQSAGGWLPEIHPSATVNRAIAAAPSGTRLLLDATAAQTMLDVGAAFPLVIAIGPEGGLTEDERQEMIDGGFAPVRLASTILRFETAGVAALGVARAIAESTIHEPVSS